MTGNTEAIPSVLTAQVRNSRRSLLVAAGAALLAALALTAGIVSAGPSVISLQAWLLVGLAVVLALAVLVPALLSMSRQSGGIDLLHPLFHAAWFFFVPQFTLASLLLVFTDYQSSAAWLLPESWLPRLTAMGMTLLGSLGLSAGFLVPFGRWIAERMPQVPVLDMRPERVRGPALLLIIIGSAGLLGTFSVGLFGYQLNPEVSTIGGLYSGLAQLLRVGYGAIWFAVFRRHRGWRGLAVVSLLLIVGGAVLSGSRGELLNSTVLIVAAYLYAQDSPQPAHLWRWGGILITVALIGMAFGTSFRLTKSAALGRTTTMSVGDVIDISQRAAAQIQSQSTQQNLAFAWERLVERIDGISSMAVIVSYADRLRAAEVSAGIDRNIVRDFVNSIVPRFLWPSKPIVGIHERIGNLYFGTSAHSPAVTYVGDLYRNFGVWGIFPGMFLLGVVLRIIYRWLIQGRPRSPVRVGLYMPLAFLANYESLYSIYLPGLMRTLVVILGAMVVVTVMGRLPDPVSRLR